MGPRTPWWRIGRRDLGDGSTGYLMGGPSVRITSGETSALISAADSYRVAGAIQRQIERVAEGHETGTRQTGH